MPVLSILVFLPLAGGILAALLCRARLARAGVTFLLFALTTLGMSIALVAGFDTGTSGLQEVEDFTWISELGIHYRLGVDGINLFLIGLTTLLWVGAATASLMRGWERAGLYFMMLGLAETATLGAFCAQDLALFVLFFDLMLVPFYFLIGIWGGPGRVAATTKFVIYTLVGSLLMLSAAVATGILATPEGGDTTFVIEELARRPLSEGTQQWIFLFFAAAFLVKMPAFPLHAWMPDAYRAAPTPVLAVLSGVLSKVGAYGFLRVVLPLFPDASVHFQELLLLVALASILYGSVMAFTQSSAILVVGYSSIAQLGFITLGIFALREEGAQGAVIQMVNHGLVVAPLFFIIAFLAARAGGSDDLDRMGGAAFRAPVLASLFLVVALATLAMPGSANFVGEFLILAGVFKAKLALAVFAGIGVALAAVYTIRLYQRSMHNPLAPGVESRDIGVRDHALLLPTIAAILALALYPQLVLERSEPSVKRSVEPARGGGRQHAPGSAPVIPLAELKAPDVDYAGLSPFLALAGGACVTLMLGLFRGSRIHLAVAASTLGTLAVAAALSIWQLGENKSIVESALRVDDLALTLDFVFLAAAATTVVLSYRDPPTHAGREGDYYALLLSSVLGMVVLAGAQNLITVFLGIELLSIPLYVMCAGVLRERTSLEAGLKYLVIGSVGSATLLYGLAFIYGATGSTDFGGIADGIRGDVLGDPLLLTGIALALTGLAFKASVAPFHQWTPDVYQGAPTPVTTFMAVATKAAAFAILLRLFDQALLPAKEDWDVAVAVLGAVSIAIGNIGAIGQDSLKRMLAWSGVAQAGYMLAGVAVASELGVKSVVFYLLVYLFMNVAAFAVVIARERETGLGDDISTVAGIGAERPLLAWPLTISMLALAGLPGTAGFVGKFFLIEAAVEGDFTWLGVAIVIGTMISLVYYLRVIAAVWMRPVPAEPLPPGPHVEPAIAGGSAEADAAPAGPHVVTPSTSTAWPGRGRTTEVATVAVIMAAASIFFGIVPSPLLDLASDAATHPEILVIR